MRGSVEGTFIDRITLRASAANHAMSTKLESSFGVLVDVAREADVGFDLALGGEYETIGFNRVPSLVTRVAAGSTVGLTRLLANASFGLGTERSERYGDLRLAGLHPVAPNLYAGLDSRARVDLERSGDEPAGEQDWDLQAGPIATYTIGRVAVSAPAGMSAWKLRSSEQKHVGAVGAVGLGAAF